MHLKLDHLSQVNFKALYITCQYIFVLFHAENCICQVRHYGLYSLFAEDTIMEISSYQNILEYWKSHVTITLHKQCVVRLVIDMKNLNF